MEKEGFSPTENPESEPHPGPILRIVGAHLSEEARQEILREKNKAFSHQERPEWSQFEVGKTQDQEELLAFINVATNTVLSGFSRDAFTVPTENYHLLNESGWKAIKRREDPFTGGSYSMEDQAIFVRAERTADPVRFSFVAYHETLHLKSYQALQRLYPGKEIVPYRQGFEVVSRHGHRRYFRKLDEAVIQELTNRFTHEELSRNPATQKALASSEERRKLVIRHTESLKDEDLQSIRNAPYIGEFPHWVTEVLSEDPPDQKKLKRALDDCKYSGVVTNAYEKEVAELNSLIDEVYERNRDQFNDREEAFNLFVTAVITGNILPIGKTIEKTFGKGSFRRLGKGENLLEN